MKIREVIEFADNEFIYLSKKGKKLIYYNKEKDTFLEIYRKKGKLEKINLLEMASNKTITKTIKLKFKSKGKIQVIVQRNNRENVSLNNKLYNDILLNCVSIYNTDGVLLEQKITLSSNKMSTSKSLKKILTTENQYCDNKKTKFKVSGENIELYEKDSNYMIESLAIYLERENICIEETKTVLKPTLQESDQTHELYMESYIIPKSLYIYDRIYDINAHVKNGLSYISDEDGLWELYINLDYFNKTVKALSLKINRTKKTAIENNGVLTPQEKEKNTIIKIQAVDDNLFRGVFTLRNSDNILINGKKETVARINGTGYYDHEKNQLISNLDIRLKHNRLKVNGSSMSYNFETEYETYHISSEEYSLFANILIFSPYIIKNIESSIWVKEKSK